MVIENVKVKNRPGIHLRLADILSKAASSFKSDIRIVKDSQEINAKSILGVATLGAEYGDKLTIKANGEDEKDALAFLVGLFDSNFSEGDN